ncbi:hypothetical protein [Gilliamella sp. Nev3-1]|jgi:hypothetical protein|uniref:hypothetical protein n=1 Tax=Gilliamella sp. Nev3-1 TaxID=3120250 RepID=UPI001C400A96|nr:hypothetical protein [Gilliamella apicola]
MISGTRARIYHKERLAEYDKNQSEKALILFDFLFCNAMKNNGITPFATSLSL